jgi:hypothetical protein
MYQLGWFLQQSTIVIRWEFATKRLIGGNLKLQVTYGVVCAIIPFVCNI